MGRDSRACDSMLPPMRASGSRSCVGIAGAVNPAVQCRTLKFITENFEVTQVTIRNRT